MENNKDKPIPESIKTSPMPIFDSIKNWNDDYEGIVGGYINKCAICEENFLGNKRRFVCKECYYSEIK